MASNHGQAWAGARPLDDEAGQNIEEIEEGVRGPDPSTTVTIQPCHRTSKSKAREENDLDIRGGTVIMA